MRAWVLLFPSCFVYYCIYFKSKYIYNNMSSIYVLHCAFIRLYEADWQSFYRNWTERTGQMRHIHCKSAHIYLRLPSAAVTRTTSTHTNTHTQAHTEPHSSADTSNRSWHSACKYLLSDLRKHLSPLCPVIYQYVQINVIGVYMWWMYI